MPDLTLDTVARYVKLRDRAGRVGTDEGSAREARVARDAADALAREYPEIRDVARRVERALQGPPDPPPAPAQAPPSPWGAVAGAVLGATADRFATQLAGELRGDERMTPIAPREVAIRTHVCAAGQVCVEIRCNAVDVRRGATRDDIMEGIEALLLAESA